MSRTTEQRLYDLWTDPHLEFEQRPTLICLSRARSWLRWVPRGAIYPDTIGGVRWEYDMKNWSVSIEFDNRGRVNVSLVEIG